MRGHLISTLTLAVLSGSASADWLVGNLHGDNVLRYSDSGSYIGVFASGATIDGPQAVAVGPDGNVYIGSEYTHNITKWSPAGTFLGSFTHASGPGFQQIAFGSDGYLYALPHITTGAGSILKFGLDGTFAGFLGDAMSAGHTHGLAWGPDGNLYQGKLEGSGAVLRIDPTTGLTTGVLVVDPNLAVMNHIAFGPDGDLYVSHPLAGGFIYGGLYRYDGSTGAFLGAFSSVGVSTSTWGIAFHGGSVYYGAGGAVAVVGSGGGLATPFITPGSGGLTVATGIAHVVPEPTSIVSFAVAATFLLRRRRGILPSSNSH